MLTLLEELLWGFLAKGSQRKHSSPVSPLGSSGFLRVLHSIQGPIETTLPGFGRVPLPRFRPTRAPTKLARVDKCGKCVSVITFFGTWVLFWGGVAKLTAQHLVNVRVGAEGLSYVKES